MTNNTSMATSLTNGNNKKIKKAEEYQKEMENELRFNPNINQTSKEINRGLNDLMQDTNRRLSQKQQLESNLAKKMRSNEVAQISSNSDKVMHDRYDNDFNMVCM